MNEYSDLELRLIKWYDVGHMVRALAAPNLYRIMVEKAFLSNDKTAYADSLRRCSKALSDGKPYRMTHEFDALIILPDWCEVPLL